MHYKSKWVWGMPLAACMVALAVMALSYAPANTVQANGGSICEGDVKFEESWAIFEAPPGQQIEFICVKAGNETFIFLPGDPGTDCIQIDWAANCAVGVDGGRNTRFCKEISHIAATFEEGDCGRRTQ